MIAKIIIFITPIIVSKSVYRLTFQVRAFVKLFKIFFFKDERCKSLQCFLQAFKPKANRSTQNYKNSHFLGLTNNSYLFQGSPYSYKVKNLCTSPYTKQLENAATLVYAL